jgi:hypothetical protein
MSSDFQRRFQGKTEMLNKQGINGIVGSSNTPIDKPHGGQMLNVNQFQPYRKFLIFRIKTNLMIANDDMYPNVNNQYNQYGMNMQELNNMEDNLNRQMDNL